MDEYYEHAYSNLFWVNEFKKYVDVLNTDSFSRYLLLYFKYGDNYYLLGYTPTNGISYVCFPFLVKQNSSLSYKLNIEYEFFNNKQFLITVKMPNNIIETNFKFDITQKEFIDIYLNKNNYGNSK